MVDAPVRLGVICVARPLFAGVFQWRTVAVDSAATYRRQSAGPSHLAGVYHVRLFPLRCALQHTPSGDFLSRVAVVEFARGPKSRVWEVGRFQLSVDCDGIEIDFLRSKGSVHPCWLAQKRRPFRCLHLACHGSRGSSARLPCFRWVDPFTNLETPLGAETDVSSVSGTIKGVAREQRSVPTGH